MTLVTKISNLLFLGQSGVFFFGYVAIFISMVYLVKTLKQSNTAAILAGVVYLLNPIVFTGLPIEIMNLKLIPFNIATPLIVAATIEVFNSENWKKKLALFAFISLLPGSLGYSSLQYFSIHLLLIVVYCLIKLVETIGSKKTLLPLLKKIFLVLLLFFLVNTFWLFPLLSNINSSYVARTEPGVSDSGLLHYLSASMPDSLRMLQYPGQSSVSPWMKYYDHPVLVILSFAIIIIGLTSLLIKKVKYYALYPTVLLIVGLFLSKGTLPFFEGLGRIIFLSFPYITRLFRNPTYFGSIIAFSTSVLFGLSSGYLVDRLIKKKNKKLHLFLFIFIVATFVIYGWPYITGSPIKESTKSPLVQSIKIPQTFIDAMNYLEKDNNDFRVISIPMNVSSRGNSMTLNWTNKYEGVGPVGVWSSKSTFVPTSQTIDVRTSAIFAPTNSVISQEDWISQLQNKNVRYVTLHQDADIPGYDGINDRQYLREQINNFVRTSPYLEKVYGNSDVEVFRLKNEYFRGHIYVDNSKTTISFHKINPTKYTVKVDNVTESFNLIFLETFSTQWKVFVGNSDQVINEDKHKLFDNYANLWKISPDDYDSQRSFNLTIEYIQQRNTYIGWGISLVTLLIISLCWLIHILKTKSNIRRKNNHNDIK